MAFSSDLTLNNAAAAAKTFTLQGQSPSESTRIDTATTVSAPRILKIRHRREGKPGTPTYRDRHTATIVHNEKDSVTGVVYTAQMDVSIQVPVEGPVDRTDINDMIAFLTNTTNGVCQLTANVDRFLRSEV